jgi:hypothetical protein
VVRSPTYGLEQVPPADLDIPVLGQLAAAQFPLDDALEPRSLEVVCLDAPLRSDCSCPLHALAAASPATITAHIARRTHRLSNPLKWWITLLKKLPHRSRTMHDSLPF